MTLHYSVETVSYKLVRGSQAVAYPLKRLAKKQSCCLVSQCLLDSKDFVASST